ncbi:MAG: hypothetical protein RLO80_00520 [Hyphomonas sp.]
MTEETDKKFGYPTHCWNCKMPLPVFTYACGLCGADNTPLLGPQDKTGGKKSSARETLKDELTRQREAIRKSLKGE